VYVAIDKHGTVLGGAFADGRQDWDQGSITVTTHLAVGEQVWARQELYGSAIRGSGNDTLHTTEFSGFLVTAE
jgi:hypothetical protein